MDAIVKRAPRPHAGPVVQYPLRAIMQLLPGLPVKADGKGIDYDAADPYRLATLREQLSTLIGIANNGVTAVGHLLALAAAEIEGGEISGESVEGLGWLLTLLGDTAGWATDIKLHCDLANADFSPQDSEQGVQHGRR